MMMEAFPEHIATFDGYKDHIQRVDLARAAMLFLHGGLYVDMDVEVFQCPFPFFEAGKVSVVASPYARNEKHQNSMMASPPRHPFWLSLVQEATDRSKQPERFKTTWQLTGPQLLDAVIENNMSHVHVLPASQFNPPATSFSAPGQNVFTRHLCTSVWTHDMDTESMRLYQAAREGNKESASAAVHAGANLQAHDYANLTPLHHAALKADSDMVSVLIKLQADVDAKDKNDSTPLHYAVQTSCMEAVDALLSARASAETRLLSGAAAGMSPLDLAQVVARESARTAQASSACQVLSRLEVFCKKTNVERNANRPWWAPAANQTSRCDSSPVSKMSLPVSGQATCWKSQQAPAQCFGRQRPFKCITTITPHKVWGSRLRLARVVLAD